MLVILAALIARSALGMRPTGVAKIALVHSFSGPLKEQGYDALSATRAAIRSRTDAQGLFLGKRVELEALDDGTTRDGATRQIAALATDSDIHGIICCSVDRVAVGVRAQAPTTTRVLLPAIRPSDDAATTVRILAGKVQPERPALVRGSHDSADPFLAALARAWHVAGVTAFQPEDGDTPEATARSLLAERADVVLMDTDASTASKLLEALRDQGYSGPVVGSAQLGVPELVTWLGPRLGEVYVPSIDANEVPPELAQAFQRERGHAPASADVLIYDAVRTVLMAPPVPHHWTIMRLDPGRFPGTDVSDT